jgi:hypothetical protein
MTPRKPADTSALAALSQAERAALLGDLLAEHPELVGDAERLANRRLASALMVVAGPPPRPGTASSWQVASGGRG